MEKLGSIIGLPILETETGMQVGEVGELLLDVEGAILCALIINGGNWFASEKIIAFRDLFSLGRDAVMVCNHHVIHELEDFHMTNHTYHLKDLCDKEIMTDTGLRLGVLKDIIFDRITGEIKWYQVSDSMITDVLYGRMLMPLPQVQIVGQGKVIVPETMAKLLHGETEMTEFE
ncbi:PRC-barrel domain-containing protein [Pelosinus sp. sgz500959]|uniref:PRC-barrel domain-containing protein n=1 Tax=Pelosinus sp. sgz500959 TaxID=3242472 RepID=UPI00366E2957